MTLRTRFAPSPTGDLHVGGARTALFCWLLARQTQGTFILRIEDTDLERSTQASVDAILEAMDWLGLDYNEGPYYQTQHFARYREVIQQLVASGHAYPCDCSKERLDELREYQVQHKEKPRYDGKCRHRKDVDLTQPHVIRFKNPETGSVVWNDLVKGRIEIANSELDDLILARSDGSPTYNLTVVVDDYDMKISHVIRGDDHVNNTPRQINLLQAMNAPIPQYAHLSMLLGKDGKRLSKRDGAAGVMEFRNQGYLPHALLNYLVRLGWSHGDQEIFSREEMIAQFSLDHITNSAATFNSDKLKWLNQHYLKTLPFSEWRDAAVWQFARHNVDLSAGPDLERLVPLLVERVHTLEELVLQSLYFFEEFPTFDPAAVTKHLQSTALPPLQACYELLQHVSDWDALIIHNTIDAVAKRLNLGMGKVAMPLRVATTGQGTTPAIDMVLELLGKTRTLHRLQRSILFIQTLTAETKTP